MVAYSELAARTLRAALLSSVALGLSGYAYAAQPNQPANDPAKLEQLEQQMQLLMHQIQDLKAKQNDQQQKIETQNQQIEEQKNQIEAQQNQPAPVPANVVTGGDKPGSFKLPGTDTSVKIGGYVKGDVIYDINSDLGDSFAFSSIPASGSVQDNREGHFRAHARQSRVNVQSWTPTPYGEVHTHIEGDFFGIGGNEVFSNSTSFRLRHAYGEFGPVLVGQTWSNFMYLDAYPDTVDFFGPVGIPFARQGQLRYTYRGIENLAVAVSLENSELSASSGSDGTFQTLGSTRRTADDLQLGIDSLPDFVGRVTYSGEPLSLNVSGVVRQLEVDDGTGATDDSTMGWGVLLAGVLDVGKVVDALEGDSLMANFTYGDGVGRYLINGANQDANLNASGSLDTIKAWGVAAGYTHYWSPDWRSNVVYGHYTVDDTFTADATESLDSLHLNLMWTPVPQVQFGMEWIYGQRNFQDSSLDNDAQRVHFAGQYFF